MTEEKTVEYAMVGCVRGYHVYNEIWEAVVGERLISERELENQMDRNAVAIKNDGKILGLEPKKISKICLLFFQRGGSISVALHCIWKEKVLS